MMPVYLLNSPRDETMLSESKTYNEDGNMYHNSFIKFT